MSFSCFKNYYTKKTVNRKIAVMVIAAILCLLIFIDTPFIAHAAMPAANADVYGMNMAFNGDPSESRGLTFFTSDKISESADILVSKSADLSNPIKYKSTLKTENLSSSGFGAKKNYYIHKAVINGLQPATKYYYKAGQESKNLWSQVCSFKTDDENSNKVSFIVTTDVHFGANELNNSESRYFDAALTDAFTRNPGLDFIANTGDLVTQWNSGYTFMQEERVDALRSSTYMYNSTFVGVTGNHDVLPNTSDFYYADYRNYNPGLNSAIDGQQGLNYSFDYGNTHFAVAGNMNANLSSAQRAWLAKDLAETGQEFKIVFLHYPAYSGAENFSGDSAAMQVFSDNGVDIVFNGHTHYYMRTKPVTGAKVSGNTVISDAANKNYYFEYPGVVYTTNSTTGGADAWESSPGMTANRESAFGLGSNPVGAGSITNRSGMYSIVSIEDGNLTVDVYVRTSTSVSGPFTLYESYGTRKNHYKEIGKSINGLPGIDTLVYNDAAKLSLYRAAEAELNDYKTKFPALAGKLDPEMKFKLETGLKILTEAAFSIADRAAINAKIAEARTRSKKDYSIESWGVFDAALSAAVTVNINAAATAQEITAATAALNNAMTSLAAVNYASLAAAIDAAENMAADTYTIETAAAVQAKLAVAKPKMTSRSQLEINAAAEELQAALDALAAPDKTALNAAIATAEALTAADYTVLSWVIMNTVLDSVKLKLDSFSQAELDAAAAELLVALDELTALNKTDIRAAIAAAEALAGEEYTTESWAALQQTLTRAKDKVSSSSQSEIDSAAAALNSAINSLVKKDTSAPVPPPKGGCGSLASGGDISGGQIIAVLAFVVIAAAVCSGRNCRRGGKKMRKSG